MDGTYYLKFCHNKHVSKYCDSLFIFEYQGTTYCYWPPRAGASAKVKRQEMPDAQKWTSYEIRIFSYAGVTLANYS